ncbi:MAG: hypothetical protein HY749_08290 [Gammaproteobacteria bacterium]|nr:hypothetical protein [Gammaproteobacteria bacterium]MBI5615255.1 hypothetical protein [Gammaproteobacteria bacterium]
MGTKMVSDGLNDLVDELKTLEAFFPLLGLASEKDELEEEVRELEDLIRAAGMPDDEHSVRALSYLKSELSRKRDLLDRI